MIRKAIIVMLTLAAVGTSGLWGYGYWDAEARRGFRAAQTWGIIDRGLGGGTYRLQVHLDSCPSVSFSACSRGHPFPPYPSPNNTHVTVAGFWYYHTSNVGLHTPRRPRLEMTTVGVPLWALTVIFAAYPAIAVIRGPLRRWRAPLPGHCQTCRYNLTGNESGVCPECGTRIEPTDGAAG